ncbi:MAG: LD-carboxypeptidase [Christensenellaceae bacterium]|jgi:muramoyltetrapeptide carboxypeptidase LdcA involved in peptidoglycan recycling|nr:LD-carboxypeptidase [Christensenellaceae bacterium]
MKELVKPQALRPGDKVAAVSLSWGGAGDAHLLWRYRAGKKRLGEVFGLEVVEMEHTLCGSAYLYEHPQARAADLMAAFADPSIKAIFSCIGGEESVRMLPFIDFDVIRRNPKIFIGYSDTTIAHLICHKAGLSSFYGPSILAELAENIEIFDYTQKWLQKTLFCTAPLGEIEPAPAWTGERLEWSEENAQTQKKLQKNTGYELLQGKGIARGRLIGGCIEVLEMAKGTALWPEKSDFDGAILFFESSEEMPEPRSIEYWLRNYGSQGILQGASALLFGKPYQGRFYEEYRRAILKITAELGLGELPILYNLSFGHNEPMCTLPYGALAELNCEKRSFSILEAGVC